MIYEKKILFFLFFAFISACTSIDTDQSRTPHHQSRPASQITIENFSLLDHEGKFHELYYYSDMKAIVLFWQGNGCPIVRQSIPYIKQLKEEYEPKGVMFLMINANSQDDRYSITEEAKEYGINIPILEDSAQVVTERLNVVRTAEVIVVDPKGWKIVYQGAMDDRFGYETQKKKPKNKYLEAALEGVLEGKEIEVKHAMVKGCLINLPGIYEKKKYTYTEDVGPVLVQKCMSCHSQGGVAPWSMDDYDKVKGWGPMIREVVRTKRMPPWKPDPYHGEFKYDISLDEGEVRALVKWVEAGMPRGEGGDPLRQAPKPDHQEWTLGEPDIVLTFKEAQQIPPSGIIPYQYLEANELIQENIWIKAFQLKAGNPRVLHHGTAMAASADYWEKEDKTDFKRMFLYPEYEVNNYVGFHASGRIPHYFPGGLGTFIEKDSKIFFEIHYITTGKPETDMTELGLYLYPEKPSRELLVGLIYNSTFRIPPGAKEHKVSASLVIDKNVLLYQLYPHMHYRGKYMTFKAEYPDGNSEILLSVPEYDFNWQYQYTLLEPKYIPSGTRIICNGAFDNSPQNLQNPDPSAEVRNGFQTFEEMFTCAIDYAVVD